MVQQFGKRLCYRIKERSEEETDAWLYRASWLADSLFGQEMLLYFGNP